MESARVLRPTHPLIGKLLRCFSEEQDFYILSRFTADLGQGLMLAKRLSPQTGEDLLVSHVVRLELLAQDMAEIFDDWKALSRVPPDGERVLKLMTSADE